MPHFYETIPPELRDLPHRDVVERYAAGAGLPAAAIAGLSPEQLNQFPVPNTWSIQQITLHLLDTDLIAAYRMKRILAEDRPRLDVYDENAFVRRLYADLDPFAAAEIFRMNRLMMATILRNASDADFGRFALHPEVGELSLSVLLRLYVHHVTHHLGFMQRKRIMVESARQA